MNTRLRFGMALGILVLVVAVLALLFFAIGRDEIRRSAIVYPDTEVKRVSESKNSPSQTNGLPATAENERMIYWPDNFGIDIPPDWTKVLVDEIALPKGLRDVQFAYRKNDTSCVFVYLHAAEPESYRHISFAKFVVTRDGDQLSPQWYLDEKDVPRGFEFRWEERQPSRGEVRMSRYRSTDTFVTTFALYSADQGIVPDSCESDTSAMLGSIASEFERIGIGSDSDGIAYIDSSWNETTHLKFIPKEDPIVRIVMELDVAHGGPAPAVHQGTLYAVSHGDLKTVDIASGRYENAIDKLSGDGQVVNEYFFSGDRIYYLFGSYCGGYMDICDLSLYEYDGATRQSKLLAEHLPYRNILTYDGRKNILFLRYSVGDAGCFSSQTGGYDFASGKIVRLPNVSGCASENDTNPPKLPKESVIDQSTYRDHMTIRNGKIVAEDDKDTSLSTGNKRWDGWDIRYIK